MNEPFKTGMQRTKLKGPERLTIDVISRCIFAYGEAFGDISMPKLMQFVALTDESKRVNWHSYFCDQLWLESQKATMDDDQIVHVSGNVYYGMKASAIILHAMRTGGVSLRRTKPFSEEFLLFPTEDTVKH